MRLMPRSLSTRLTLAFTAGATAVLLLCLALLYVALDRQLTSTLDEGLAARADDLTATIRRDYPDVVSDDPMAELYDASGRVLVASVSLDQRSLLSADEVRTLQAELRETRTLPNGPTVRIVARRIEPDRVLAVGVSAEPLQEARQRLLLVLLVAAPLLVGALAVGGWLLVRGALRPVDVLSREAAAISSVESGKSLPQVPGDDEIARLARTLDDMLNRLRIAFERERAFVDDAGHELRTPIAVLRGELELALLAADEPQEVERSLRAALREADRLSRVAEDLLLLARERSGSLVVRREPVDLLELATTEGAAMAAVHRIQVEVTGDAVVVEGDPDRLAQVLRNTVQNSATAGARHVRIHLRRAEPGVVLEVADDGPGFPEAILESAFERFVRGDDARATAGAGAAGAGLGLAIVRAIVAAHNGTVDARNGKPLGGAVVTARLR